MQDLSRTLEGIINTVQGDLEAVDGQARMMREWIEASKRLAQALRESPGGYRLPSVPSMLDGHADGHATPAPPPSSDGHAALAPPPMSLRQALRQIFAGLPPEPITVAELMVKLQAIGITPKDADSVDSTIYNLKNAGVPLVKVSQRTWRRAVESAAAKADGKGASSAA